MKGFQRLFTRPLRPALVTTNGTLKGVPTLLFITLPLHRCVVLVLCRNSSRTHVTRRYSCAKVPISRLSVRSSSCIPTARWVPRKEGEKRHSRGRIKIGKYVYHAYVVPPCRFWSNSIKPYSYNCLLTNATTSH